MRAYRWKQCPRRSMAVKVDRRRPQAPVFRLTTQDVLFCFAVSFALTVLLMVGLSLIVKAMT